MEIHFAVKAAKSCLGSKEQKGTYLVVSSLDLQFGFEHPYFVCPIGPNRTQKGGRVKSNLPTSDNAKNTYKTKKLGQILI